MRFLGIWYHSGFQKYFRNTGWLFGEKLLRLGVGLFVSVWVARYLGPAQFGLYNYAISFAGLFTVIATFGLDGIVVRELVKHPDKKDVLLGTSFYLKVIGAFLSLVILAFAIFLTNNTDFEKLLIFIVASSVIFQSFSVIDFYFQSKILSKFSVFAGAISFLVTSILKVILIVNQAPLVYFVCIVLLDSLLLALGYLYFYKKQDLNLFVWNFDKKVAKDLLKDSWPLIFASIASVIYMKIDQVMIKNILGDEAVGVYSVAVRLSEVWYFIPVLISASIFPAILNVKDDKKLYHSRLVHLYSLVVWLSVLISLIITFFSSTIVNSLYGLEYAGSIPILMAYVWSSIFVSLGVASNNWFVAENLQLLSFFRTFSGGIINVVLNIIFIRQYGMYGAAISTLISYAFAGYFFDLFHKKTRSMFFLKSKSIFFRKII
jgi:O-antigen/teichoic acid export membrane protein